MSNHHQVKNGEPLVSDSEYSCGLAFGFGGMHSCSIGQVVVNINKNEVKKEKFNSFSLCYSLRYSINLLTLLICVCVLG